MDRADWRRGPGFDSGLNWLLDGLVSRVAQVGRAVILSRDGLAIGASGRLSLADAGTRRHSGRLPEPGVKRVGAHLSVNPRPVPARGPVE